MVITTLGLLFDLKCEILSAVPRFCVQHLTLSPSAAVRQHLNEALISPSFVDLPLADLQAAAQPPLPTEEGVA